MILIERIGRADACATGGCVSRFSEDGPSVTFGDAGLKTKQGEEGGESAVGKEESLCSAWYARNLGGGS